MSKFVRIDDAAADERVSYFAELLPEELLSERGVRLIGAVTEDGLPEGVAVFAVNEYMVDLLHIEVYEPLRRQGIGTSLVRTLLEYLAMTGLPFVLQAIYSEPDGEEDAVADAFFRSMPDFEVVSGGKYYTVTPDTVWNEARLKFISRFDCSVKSFDELSNLEKNSLIGDLQERGVSSLLYGGTGKLIPELSLCHLEKGRCSACAIFRESDLPDTIEFSFLMSKPHKEDHLAGVLRAVIQKLKESYPRYNIGFCAVNRESEHLAKNFFKSGMKVSEILTAVSFGEVW